jgi:transcriptional regulator with GAF, ATPase, and Fis domain
MAQEALVVRALVEMADTLVGDFDVVDLLTRLADGCVNLLGVSAAGVMLASAQGDLRLVASSSEAMRVLELFELRAQEGPCLDGFRTGEPVEHENLRAGSGPWPQFASAAIEAGFQSVSALPLRLRHAIIGALNLFNVEQTPIEAVNLVMARAFADLAAISVMQHRASTETQRVNQELSHALTSRILIEQAKGVIAGRTGIGIEEVFARLRRYARSHELRLTDVAQAAIDGTLDALAWGPPIPL